MDHGIVLRHAGLLGELQSARPAFVLLVVDASNVILQLVVLRVDLVTLVAWPGGFLNSFLFWWTFRWLLYFPSRKSDFS